MTLYGALALSGLLSAQTPTPHPARKASVIAIPGGGGTGEISRYTVDGRLLFRWTGFSDIETIEVAAPERLMVLEGGGTRFVEFDYSGDVHRSGSFQQQDVFQGVVLPGGHFLLAAGKEGVVEVDGSGGVAWRAPAPHPPAEVVSAVRLADGTTLCAARFASVPMYQIAAGSTRFVPVTPPGIGPFADRWKRPRLRVVDPAAQKVALWYAPWRSWYQFQWEKGNLQRWSTFPAKGDVSAVAPGRGHSAWTAQAQFEVVRLSSSGKESGWFAVADAIRDLTEDHSGDVVVAVERTQNVERAARRPPSSEHTPFSWARLGVWMLGTILLLGVLQLIVWRNAPSAEEPAFTPMEPRAGTLSHEVHSHFRAWIVCTVVAGAGLALASIGSTQLHDETPSRAIPFYLLGAPLIAVAGQWWRRKICRQEDRWWSETRAARAPGRLFIPTVPVVVILFAGGLTLWLWQSRGIHRNDTISLWASLQVLCFGVAALSPRPPRFREWKIPWETITHIAGLLLLASIALSSDLEGVPRNVHNDVGAVVDSAIRLLEGRVDDFFSGGYAEVPYPGHLPTSLGLLIAGKTVAGSRWGVMLMGLVAVLGTYALGREYKSARLGLFASLLLLASIPFLHFSRSTHFGEVVGYSVWLLYLLLRAVRTARPGTWLVFGVVGCWGLFLFYSARVALAGVVVAGVLLSLRSYRVTSRRWYGPLLFALGFTITVVPMVPYWRSHPGAFSHRMDTSFSLYDPHTGFHGGVLARAFGEPFLRTLGMFYTERDGSGQGTMSPAAGPIEATLLSIGLAAVMTDGWGAGIACLGWFVVVLLGCGVFAQATPWYTRLVPLTPVASLFMARAIDLLLDFFPLRRSAFKRVVTASVSVALMGLAAKNLETYLRYERARPATEFTAFGQAALALGSKYQFYCVTFQRPDFSCLHSSFVPYLASLDVRDLRDPVRAMPFPAGRPVAIMIPFARFVPHPLHPEALVNEIRARYPGAKPRYVYENQSASHSPLGVVVVVSP